MSNCLLYDSCHTAVEPARYSCASPDDLAKSRNLWDVHRPLNNITLGEVKMSHDGTLVCLRGPEGLRKKEMAVGRFGKSALGNSEGTWSSSTPREAPAQLLRLTCFHNRNEVDRQSCICCATTHSDGSGFNAVRISGACRCNFLRAPQACGRRQDSTRPIRQRQPQPRLILPRCTSRPVCYYFFNRPEHWRSLHERGRQISKSDVRYNAARTKLQGEGFDIGLSAGPSR